MTGGSHSCLGIDDWGESLVPIGTDDWRESLVLRQR